MNLNSSNRRRFIRGLALAGAASAINLDITAAPVSTKKIALNEGGVILFQGDSITDAGRNKNSKDANNANAMGSGYALLAASQMLKQNAGKKLTIYNRGISGNKVYQLAERWEEDCLKLKPDVLSILIGVNDFWHKLNGSYNGTVEKYATDFEALLTRTKEQLPDVKLIIGEPFAVSGVKAVDEKWYPAFNDYRASAFSIAQKFGAVFIPYQTVFDKAQKAATASYWTGDGVHPSLAGCELMAEAWLNTVKL